MLEKYRFYIEELERLRTEFEKLVKTYEELEKSGEYRSLANEFSKQKMELMAFMDIIKKFNPREPDFRIEYYCCGEYRARIYIDENWEITVPVSPTTSLTEIVDEIWKKIVEDFDKIMSRTIKLLVENINYIKMLLDLNEKLKAIGSRLDEIENTMNQKKRKLKIIK